MSGTVRSPIKKVNSSAQYERMHNASEEGANTAMGKQHSVGLKRAAIRRGSHVGTQRTDRLALTKRTPVWTGCSCLYLVVGAMCPVSVNPSNSRRTETCGVPAVVGVPRSVGRGGDDGVVGSAVMEARSRATSGASST
jgi:hypothetical protein